MYSVYPYFVAGVDKYFEHTHYIVLCALCYIVLSNHCLFNITLYYYVHIETVTFVRQLSRVLIR